MIKKSALVAVCMMQTWGVLLSSQIDSYCWFYSLHGTVNWSLVVKAESVAALEIHCGAYM
jgi:energy-converting hydrogenase Eha subunit H